MAEIPTDPEEEPVVPKKAPTEETEDFEKSWLDASRMHSRETWEGFEDAARPQPHTKGPRGRS